MSYHNGRTFKTEDDAGAYLRRHGYTESRVAPGHWARVRGAVYSFVSVGPCRTGEYLICEDATMRNAGAESIAAE